LDSRNHAQIEHQLPGFIAFVGAVHQQWKALRHGAQLFQQGPPMRRIVVVSGRQRKRYGRSSIRRNHMNLGIPSAAGFSNGLWSVFFKAPVPSG
jgi:hypothetical protein